MTSINRFTDDNTEGYTAADLITLNARFAAACQAEGIDADDADADKSHLDAISERVLADYDSALYTVTSAAGDVIDSGLTAVEAMNVILTDDGHEYEIRPEVDGDGYRLWTSTYSRNSTAYNGLRQSVIYSLASNVVYAEEEIAHKVIEAGWPRKPAAVTDESHAAMMAELAADEATDA
jgi:hypothetical protein